jgi:hypothetical protein
VGSKSCEGREKRTEARSATPMNLRSRMSAWARQPHHDGPARHQHDGQAPDSGRTLGRACEPGLVFRVVATHAKRDMGQGGAAAPNGMNGEAGAVRDRHTHFFKMPIKMRSLELSLWFSSAGGAIVGGAPDADMVEGRGVGRQDGSTKGRRPVLRGRAVCLV